MIKNNMKIKFWFLLILTVMAVAAVVTLTVFTFKFVEEIGLLQCLFVGVGMASLIALVAVTVWHGLAAYRN